MAVTYRGVHWNREKVRYDLGLLVIVAAGMGAFAGVSAATNPYLTAESLIIRTTAAAAFVLLHVVLCIGPLARLDARFLPILYNRRHLGVVTFLLAAVHAAVSTVQFHGFSEANPIASVFTAYSMEYSALAEGLRGFVHFPFEPFGALALVILFLMAATSHDFWLRNLGPSVWKTLHLLVYVAYGALVVHVVLGFLQYERSAVYPLLLGGGLFAVFGLHIAAFLKETGRDVPPKDVTGDGYAPVCAVDDLEEGKGYAGFVKYDRVAVYRAGDRVYALSNVCRHQGGPIGEGQLVDGLVTCPWHGWNYNVRDGVSPPPFNEALPTFPVLVDDGVVYVHPEAYPLRSENTGAPVDGGRSALVTGAAHEEATHGD